jgi:hypothetical protein
MTHTHTGTTGLQALAARQRSSLSRDSELCRPHEPTGPVFAGGTVRMRTVPGALMHLEGAASACFMRGDRCWGDAAGGIP